MAHPNAPSVRRDSPPSRALLLDLVERATLLAMLIFFLSRLLPSVGAEPYNLLLALMEGLTVLLVLIRKPGAMALTASAWTVAIVGTAAPLFAAPAGAVLAPLWLGMLLMSIGVAISLAAKISLNRSFGIVAANRGVKRRGPYRLCRHPMYLGYVITHAGFLLLHFTLINLLVYVICWTALVLRMGEEEAFLLQDEAYRDYAATVRHRLLPGLY